MKNIFFVSFFISILQNGFSQNESKIDSLKKVILTLHGSPRVDCLNELSETYIGLPDWFAEKRSKTQMDSGEILASQALQEAKKINYIYGMAKATSLKSKVAFEEFGNYPDAEKLSRESVSLYRKTLNKKDLNKAYWNLGRALYTNNLDAALNYLDTSYDLSKKAGDSFYVLCSVVVSANICFDKGDYTKTFERILILHQLNTNSNYAQWKAWELQLLENLYFALEDYSSALKYNRQASNLGGPQYARLAILFALNKQFDSAQKYFNLTTFDTSNRRALEASVGFFGQYYLLLNNYDKALPNLLRSLNYHKQYKDVNQIMRVLIDISKTYFALQNHDSAFKYAQEALAVARQTGAKQVLRDACKILSSIFDQWHRPDSAYSYYKQYREINDSILNDQVKGKLVGYSFEQKIELLSNEKEIQQIQLQKQSFQKNILIAGIVVFLFIAFLLWRNNRHKQKANALLQQQKEKVESTLTELKSTQAQLIHSEKMASLGELTAGIAHEIQNPLNFVKNFSEVNTELLAEMNDEIGKGNYDEVKAIAKNVTDNQQKINLHGKRADSIVKGMLQHSRSSSGQKEPTDINALADEYLRLAYHGLRAKDKTFNAKLETDFDNTIGKINVIPQDIGRVLVNLINNAFYAASLPLPTGPAYRTGRQADSKGGFSEADSNKIPTVWLSTKKENNKILISVRDNGPGIPPNILDKIFHPFFTTKPTGQGTGLGLSLAYDIVKAHGGEIKVETKEDEGSEFVFQLPYSA